MNERTGAIARFERRSDAVEAGYDVPLSAEQAEKLGMLSRKERKIWAAEQRKASRPKPRRFKPRR